MSGKAPSGSHCAAIAGPYLSGKTLLLEAVLYICKSIPRLGSIKEGNTVGDPSDVLWGNIRQSELHDLTINLRSQTMGISMSVVIRLYGRADWTCSGRRD